jgi:hypothetical protein
MTLQPAGAITVTLSPDQLAPEGNYNVQMGSLRLGLSGNLNVCYDDNITSGSSSSEKEEGWCITPALGLVIDWPISPILQIGSGVQIGYKYYPDSSGEDQLLFTGAGGVLEAGINADVRVGNGVIRLSESFSSQVDTLATAIQDEQDDYVLYRNTIGARYQVDLSEYTRLVAEAKHADVWTNKSEYDYQDHQMENLDLVVLWAMNSSLRLGPYLSWEQYTYTEDKHNDSDGVSAGLVAAYTRVSGFKAEASIGYESVDFDSSNSVTATDDSKNLKGQVEVSFKSSEFTRHALAYTYGSKQGTLASGTNFALESKLVYGINVDVSENLTFTGEVSYVDRVESDGGTDSVLYRYGVGLEYRFNDLTKVSLKVKRTEKDSDLDVNDYERNKIEANLLYHF